MNALIEYHRPATLDGALALLGRPSPITRPLGGGTHWRRLGLAVEAFVDINGLGLDGIENRGDHWHLGAATTLEAIAQNSELPAVLRQSCLRQASRNVRQRSTLGGMLASRDSGPLLTCLLALDALVCLEPACSEEPVANVLNRVPDHQLLVAIRLPATRTIGYAEISRTASDVALACLAASVILQDGQVVRARVAVGGAGRPTSRCLAAEALLEGANALGPAPALTGTASGEAVWFDDARASAAYRTAMMPILFARAVRQLFAE